MGRKAVVGQLHDRMPVILASDEEDRWLTASDEETLESLLDPYPDAHVAAYEVPTAVNDPTTDSPELVEPVDAEQFGLDEFA